MIKHDAHNSAEPDGYSVQIMGIVNVTPDSFSDSGRYKLTEDAVQHAMNLYEQGAHILDIGGESTRPGADTVSSAQEIDRVCPVIEKLRHLDVVISIDTRNAQTMKAALAAGAGMINDVTALQDDPEKMKTAKSADSICLMHMQGQPQTMQENPEYSDVVEDVYAFLAERIQACVDSGIDKQKLIADPGIGFGKTLAHNLQLLQKLDRFQDLGVRLLLGTSRKTFISKIDSGAGVNERLGGSIASALWGVQKGCSIVRVHDVAATRQALAVQRAIQIL